MPSSPTAPPSAVTRVAGSKPTSSIPRDSAPARAPWFAGGLRERPLVDLAAVRENIFQLVLPNLRTDPSPVHGWRLLRAIGDTYTWIDLPTLGDGIAVLGSHPECDLVLTDDPCIAHRHLAAVAVRSCKDAPHANRLRLIDLKTGVPMFGDDDEPRWAVADAALSVRVGHHLLYAYPVGPGDAVNDAPDDGDLHASALGAPVASGPQSSQSALLGGTQGRVRLTAEGRGTGASIELPLDALDDGVVLGRGCNCLDAALRRVLDDGAISCTHLLLLRDRDELLAFDLRSTNGTRVGGRRIRRHRIDTAETLELGRKVALHVTCLEG